MTNSKMRGFAAVNKPPGQDKVRPPGLAQYEKPDPALLPAKTVGRNDPCPCGSGKKSKRCCTVLGCNECGRLREELAEANGRADVYMLKVEPLQEEVARLAALLCECTLQPLALRMVGGKVQHAPDCPVNQP